jgi:hypothetical protein
MPAKPVKRESESDTSYDVVSVQKANKNKGHKITIPIRMANFIEAEVGSKVFVQRLEIDGERALILTKVKPPRLASLGLNSEPERE